MKQLLTIVLILAATAASATLLDDSMGMFFSEHDYFVANTNWDTDGTPFEAHIVLVNPTMQAIGAYEVRIDMTDPRVFILHIDGTNGWTNFGENTNHLAGYSTPLPVTVRVLR